MRGWDPQNREFVKMEIRGQWEDKKVHDGGRQQKRGSLDTDKHKRMDRSKTPPPNGTLELRDHLDSSQQLKVT